MDQSTLDDLARRLVNALPQGVRDLQEDVEKNVRGVLERSFQRLDLVTREEFEVQREVLIRTREKVEALEQRVEALEAQLGVGQGGGYASGE